MSNKTLNVLMIQSYVHPSSQKRLRTFSTIWVTARMCLHTDSYRFLSLLHGAIRWCGYITVLYWKIILEICCVLTNNNLCYTLDFYLCIFLKTKSLEGATSSILRKQFALFLIGRDRAWRNIPTFIHNFTKNVTILIIPRKHDRSKSTDNVSWRKRNRCEKTIQIPEVVGTFQAANQKNMM